MEEDEDLAPAVAEVRSRWEEAAQAAARHVQALQSCGLKGGTGDSAAVPRLNALAQDCLSTLRSLQRQLELLAQQLPSLEEGDACLKTLEEWKIEYKDLHMGLRNANLQAKANIEKATKEERELLLGGGQDSKNLRQSLQTQAGMTAAAESITGSLRRTRQIMMQEVERGINTLGALDESNMTLKKAEAEYKGQRSLLQTTRHLLTVMKRQDVLDRIILVAGFIFFSLVVSYVFHQRIGTFKMLRRASQLVASKEDGDQVSTSIATDVSYTPHAKASKQNPSVVETSNTLVSTSSYPTKTHSTSDPATPSPSSHEEL